MIARYSKNENVRVRRLVVDLYDFLSGPFSSAENFDGNQKKKTENNFIFVSTFKYEQLLKRS